MTKTYRGSASRDGNVWGTYVVHIDFDASGGKIVMDVNYTKVHAQSVASYNAKKNLTWNAGTGAFSEGGDGWKGTCSGPGNPCTITNKFGDTIVLTD